MCMFKSGIITYKNKSVIHDLDNDSHEKLIEKAGLDDSTREPKFVRVKIIPSDGDIFNHDLKNWALKVDQDSIPDWFDKKKAEKLMIGILQETFKERFIIAGSIERIDKGRWFLGGSAQVEYICDSAQVEYIGGSAQVKYIGGSAQVEYIYGSAQVENIGGSAQVKYIGGSAQVENIGGSAQVEHICGSAQVENIGGRAVCCFTGSKSKYKSIKEDGIAILYYKDKPEIIVANKGFKLVRFKKEAK